MWGLTRIFQRCQLIASQGTRPSNACAFFHCFPWQRINSCCKNLLYNFFHFLLLIYPAQEGGWVVCVHTFSWDFTANSTAKSQELSQPAVGFLKKRVDIDCSAFCLTRARDLVLRNHHAPLKKSGLGLILKHLELKIIPENVDLSCCYYTKGITNSFDPQNWHFLLPPSSRSTSYTLSSYPHVKYFQLDFSMSKGTRSWPYLCTCMLLSVYIIKIYVAQYMHVYYFSFCLCEPTNWDAFIAGTKREKDEITVAK